MSIRQTILRIAKDHPETRKHLLPLIKSSGSRVPVSELGRKAIHRTFANLQKEMNHIVDLAAIALVPEGFVILDSESYLGAEDTGSDGWMMTGKLVFKDMDQPPRGSEEVRWIFSRVLDASPRMIPPNKWALHFGK